MSFIDVGQGDSVLVQAGGESYLVDAGRAEEGPNIVDFLRDRGVRDLDGLIVSNSDADHIGGFFDAFEVETVFLSGDPKGTLTSNTFLRAARDEGSDTEVVRAGMLLGWGGVQADVIAPPTDAEGGLFSENNDNSLAIILTYGPRKALSGRRAQDRGVHGGRNLHGPAHCGQRFQAQTHSASVSASSLRKTRQSAWSWRRRSENIILTSARYSKYSNS